MLQVPALALACFLAQGCLMAHLSETIRSRLLWSTCTAACLAFPAAVCCPHVILVTCPASPICAQTFALQSLLHAPCALHKWKRA
jgi:hypothetical protein